MPLEQIPVAVLTIYLRNVPISYIHIFIVPKMIFLMQNSRGKKGTGCCSNLLVRYAVETGVSDLLQQGHTSLSTVCSIMWVI